MSIRSFLRDGAMSLGLVGIIAAATVYAVPARADTTVYSAPGGSLVAPGSVITNGVVYHDNASGIVQGRYTVKDSAGKLHTVVGRFASVSDAVGYAIGVNTAAGGYHPVNVSVQSKTLNRGLKALPAGVTSIVATRTKTAWGVARAVSVTRSASVSNAKGGNFGKAH